MYRSEDLSKYSAKPWFFSEKKLRYLKTRISTKFRRLLFLFYFLAFLAFFSSISPIQTCQKIMEFFVVFYSKGHFTNDFWKILKVLLEKKILICEIFFFQNFAVYYFFFYFFIIFDILFSIWSICTCKKILEIFRFFYFMD